MKPMQMALIGIGGIGRMHLELIQRVTQEGRVSCIAYCDPNPAASPEQAALLASMGAIHYEDYRVLIDSHPTLDAVAIVTPIPLHKPMFLYAMERGIHVFMEKPPCVAIEDLDEMLAATERSGKLAAINFQNTSGGAFRVLLQQLQSGVIGEIRSVTGIGMFHRDDAYFARAPWAGKLKINGAYVLDGPTMNALSHLLNNCLIAAGAGNPQSAEPRTVQAELYRANRIESEDTSCIRIQAKNGVSVHYYATLCGRQSTQPMIRIVGAKGELEWSYANTLKLHTSEGETKDFFFPEEGQFNDKFYNMYDNFLRVWRGEEERLFCSLADCRSFLLAANGAFTASSRIHPIPEPYAQDEHPAEGSSYTYIPEIGEHMQQAAASGKLYSELAIPWAVTTTTVDMTDYKRLDAPMAAGTGQTC
jgi:predicted dehydrogenase